MESRWIQNDHLNLQESIPAIRSFIGMMIRECQFELHIDVRTPGPNAPADLENPELIVNFDGKDAELLLERGAELLKAIEYMTLKWLRLDPRYYDRIRFDCRDYKYLRIQELKLTAETAAERVKKSRQPFRLNPMNARERRIIHLALRDDAAVRTVSEGSGETRQVVIYPAGMAPPRASAAHTEASEPHEEEAQE